MVLKCVAIDDEPLALDLIRNYISKIPVLELSNIFENAISGIEYLNKNKIDILLVDINMPDISGIELVKSLKEKTVVIFTTAYRQFAYEGFELAATDYLLKPIDFNRFEKAIQKAVDFYHYKNPTQKPNISSNDYIYVHSEYKMIKIDLHAIEYIESMEDYIRIHFITNEKSVMTLMPLKKVLEKLPPEKFKRIHRSYVIALDKIKSIKSRKISTQNIELPIGSSYVDNVKSWVHKT